MEQLLEFFKITGPWAAGILGTWIILNIIGELVEKTGKIVPEFMKVRKFFIRKKEEKQILMFRLTKTLLTKRITAKEKRAGKRQRKILRFKPRK